MRWVREGFLVAVLDRPSDRKNGLWNFRTTSEHAADVKQAIAAIREVAPVPVWLVGTSMGSLSAANAAARLPEGGPDGIVLTSSVTETSKASYETTRHAGLVKQLMTFQGGRPAISPPCEARSPHGYLGIEATVVSAIGAWIRAH
jgi:pimeloyl-ACP methyl ester carboxylesterase